MKRPLLRLLLWLLLVCSLGTFAPIASVASAAEGGFLFVTTRGELQAQDEQIYFAVSQDGFRWEALNGSKPVVTSTVGEKGARDPFLLRAQNGKFYLLATNLCIFANRDWQRAMHDGSHALVIWESEDLVHWSQPRLAEVAAPDAGCAWSPEAIFNSANEKYLVYWASKNKRDNYAKNRIWGAWTKDFQTFSEPFIYLEKDKEVADLDIVRGDDDKYYRFMRDEKVKGITMEVCDSLMGQWIPVAGATVGEFKACQGPTCYPLNLDDNGVPSMWCLMLDYGGRLGYKPVGASSLSNGKFTPIAGFTFPFQFRQGSVLPLSAEEYERLKKAYP
jgi:hypothetical protein